MNTQRMFTLSAGAVLALWAGGAAGRFARDPVDRTLARLPSTITTSARSPDRLEPAAWSQSDVPAPAVLRLSSGGREDGPAADNPAPTAIAMDSIDAPLSTESTGVDVSAVRSTVRSEPVSSPAESAGRLRDPL